LLLEVNGDLLADRQTGSIMAQNTSRLGQPEALQPAQRDALERDDGLGDELRQSGQRFDKTLGRAQRKKHERHLGVTGEEARASALAVKRAVDAQEHGS